MNTIKPSGGDDHRIGQPGEDPSTPPWGGIGTGKPQKVAKEHLSPQQPAEGPPRAAIGRRTITTPTKKQGKQKIRFKKTMKRIKAALKNTFYGKQKGPKVDIYVGLPATSEHAGLTEDDSAVDSGTAESGTYYSDISLKLWVDSTDRFSIKGSVQAQLTQILESLRRIATERQRDGKKELGGLKEFQTDVEEKITEIPAMSKEALGKFASQLRLWQQRTNALADPGSHPPPRSIPPKASPWEETTGEE
jgi:hypothetical protein